MLEIHNEQINDLLLAQNQQAPKLDIKEVRLHLDLDLDGLVE